MANYEASFRTNYFRVNDPEAFKVLCEQTGVEYWEEDDKTNPGQHVYGCGEFSSMPGQRNNDDDYEEIDFPEEVAKLLKDGEVAVFMESGNEKLRFVSGYAIAINNKMERREVSLTDIYELARTIGNLDSTCEY